MTFAAEEWCFEIPPETQAEAWQQSQHFAEPDSRWNAYLNQVCLDVLLPWIQTEYALEASAWLDHSSIWEFVNGTAIAIGETRLVLLPSEVMDDGALEVPQEWVDIPSWASDYYFAVQVKSDGQADDQWVRVWGYTTHQKLKESGNYDASDRTYCMDTEHLTRDQMTFWVRYQLCPEEQTRTVVAPLLELPTAQAGSLIQRLGSPAVAFPRLSVPFALWGALLERMEWRQALYQQRQGEQPQGQDLRPVQLREWFQHIFNAGWQAATAYNFRSNLLTAESDVIQAKVIEFMAPEPQHVLLFMGLKAEAEDRVGIRVQVHPSGDQYIPVNLTLVMLAEEGEVVQTVQAGEQDNCIQLKRFRCPIGSRFRLQIVLDEYSTTEFFEA
jgi:hypothetical protein